MICLSIVLFASVLSARAPMFFTNTFDTPPTLAATETTGARYTDRYPPTACRLIPAREHSVSRACVCLPFGSRILRLGREAGPYEVSLDAYLGNSNEKKRRFHAKPLRLTFHRP
jgi:hypothetical protein